MNSLLQLKGTFDSAPNSSGFGPPNIPSNKDISTAHLQKLKKSLEQSLAFWRKEQTLNGGLVSVFYNKIAAKSNRIEKLLSSSSKKSSSSIVGARFSDDENPKHIITHYVSLIAIQDSIVLLEKCIFVLSNNYKGILTFDSIKQINGNKSKFDDSILKKSTFIRTLVDAYYVEYFDVLVDDTEINNDFIITLYKTDVNTKALLRKLGIDIDFNRITDETTVLLI